ncbi:hypothetical protein PR048_006073 [Dryococelus australis]|uniref:Uncharacterized protein n=1 Tax=Dryococelus australis TaxID=614101 RepID=A0ABQ9I9Y4_9NEOP|nr:hypothetical protein PR048_006073 [Dryococelus australis]
MRSTSISLPDHLITRQQFCPQIGIKIHQMWWEIHLVGDDGVAEKDARFSLTEALLSGEQQYYEALGSASELYGGALKKLRCLEEDEYALLFGGLADLAGASKRLASQVTNVFGTSRHPLRRVLQRYARGYGTRAEVAERLSEPGSIPGRFTPDFRKWESCRTNTLVDWFSRGSPVSPRQFIPVLLHSHPISLSLALKTSLLRTATSELSILNNSIPIHAEKTKVRCGRPRTRCLAVLVKGTRASGKVCLLPKPSCLPLPPALHVAPFSTPPGADFSQVAGRRVQQRHNLHTHWPPEWEKIDTQTGFGHQDMLLVYIQSQTICGAAMMYGLVPPPPSFSHLGEPGSSPGEELLSYFRMRESCRTLPLVGGFSRGDLPFSPPLHSGAAPYSPCFTLIGSQDLNVKSRPNTCAGFARGLPRVGVREESPPLPPPIRNLSPANCRHFGRAGPPPTTFQKEGHSQIAIELSLSLSLSSTTWATRTGRGVRHSTFAFRRPCWRGGETGDPRENPGMIPTCENPVAWPRIESGSPWLEASGLTTQPPKSEDHCTELLGVIENGCPDRRRSVETPGVVVKQFHAPWRKAFRASRITYLVSIMYRLFTWLASSPPTKANRTQSPTGSLPDFRMWESCRRYRWSAGFLGDFRFSPTFHCVAAPYSPQSSSSALKTSLLRAAQISRHTLTRATRVKPAANESLWSCSYSVPTRVRYVAGSTLAGGAKHYFPFTSLSTRRCTARLVVCRDAESTETRDCVPLITFFVRRGTLDMSLRSKPIAGAVSVSRGEGGEEFGHRRHPAKYPLPNAAVTHSRNTICDGDGQPFTPPPPGQSSWSCRGHPRLRTGRLDVMDRGEMNMECDGPPNWELTSGMEWKVYESRESGQLCDKLEEQRVAPEVTSERKICDCEYQRNEACDWQTGLLDWRLE